MYTTYLHGRRLEGTPISVRLVRGAYWDYETVIAQQRHWSIPVFTRKSETDINFERLVTLLLEHIHLLRPAIATHNVRSIAYALATSRALDLPERAVEFQMLYGMGDAIKATLIQLGQRVRVYAPFGELLPGMGYLVRRLLENTSNDSFLRQSFVENTAIDALLRSPFEVAPGKEKIITGRRLLPYKSQLTLQRTQSFTMNQSTTLPKKSRATSSAKHSCRFVGNLATPIRW